MQVRELLRGEAGADDDRRAVAAGQDPRRSGESPQPAESLRRLAAVGHAAVVQRPLPDLGVLLAGRQAGGVQPQQDELLDLVGGHLHRRAGQPGVPLDAQRQAARHDHGAAQDSRPGALEGQEQRREHEQHAEQEEQRWPPSQQGREDVEADDDRENGGEPDRYPPDGAHAGSGDLDSQAVGSLLDPGPRVGWRRRQGRWAAGAAKARAQRLVELGGLADDRHPGGAVVERQVQEAGHPLAGGPRLLVVRRLVEGEPLDPGRPGEPDRVGGGGVGVAGVLVDRHPVTAGEGLLLAAAEPEDPPPRDLDLLPPVEVGATAHQRAEHPAEEQERAKNERARPPPHESPCPPRAPSTTRRGRRRRPAAARTRAGAGTPCSPACRGHRDRVGTPRRWSPPSHPSPEPRPPWYRRPRAGGSSRAGGPPAEPERPRSAAGAGSGVPPRTGRRTTAVCVDSTAGGRGTTALPWRAASCADAARGGSASRTARTRRAPPRRDGSAPTGAPSAGCGSSPAAPRRGRRMRLRPARRTPAPRRARSRRTGSRRPAPRCPRRRAGGPRRRPTRRPPAAPARR